MILQRTIQILLLLVSRGCRGGVRLWTSVHIDTSWFDSSYKEETYQLDREFHCGALCGMKPFCTTWCLDLSQAQACRLTDMITSPSYLPKTDSTRECHTQYRIDYVANTFCSSTFGEKPALVDGIVNRNDNYDPYMYNYPKPYLLFDLGVMRLIHGLVAYNSGSTWSGGRFDYSHIRVGNVTSPDATFNGYVMLKEFSRMIIVSKPYGKNEVELRTPVVAQFLSIQKDSNAHLHLSHVEIY